MSMNGTLPTPEDIKRVKGLGFLHDKTTADCFNARVITRNGRLQPDEIRAIVDAAEKFGSQCVVVAIDASVGSPDHVGFATLGKGALQPGLGVSKELGEVGDISITGIVGGAGNHDPVMLQSVRLSMVMKMADCICESIALVERFWENTAII